MRPADILPADQVPALTARATAFLLAREQTIPPQLAIRDEPLAAFGIALPLLVDRVERDATAPHMLRLTRLGLPPIGLDPATGAWRCDWAEGNGPLELIAFVRGCRMLDAACWYFAARQAVRRGGAFGGRA